MGGVGVALAVTLALPSAQSRGTQKPEPVQGISQVPRPDSADLDAVARWQSSFEGKVFYEMWELERVIDNIEAATTIRAAYKELKAHSISLMRARSRLDKIIQAMTEPQIEAAE